MGELPLYRRGVRRMMSKVTLYMFRPDSIERYHNTRHTPEIEKWASINQGPHTDLCFWAHQRITHTQFSWTSLQLYYQARTPTGVPRSRKTPDHHGA